MVGDTSDGAFAAVSPLLGVADVAQLLHLPVRAVYVLVETGQLAHYKIGSRVRVSERQVDEFLAAREHRRAAP